MDASATYYAQMMIRRGEIERSLRSLEQERTTDAMRGVIQHGDSILADVNRDGYVVIRSTIHAPNTALTLGLGLVRLFSTPEQAERVRIAMLTPDF